jgi:hypothetical protein
MNRTEFRRYRRQLLKEAHDIALAKGKDYAGNSDVNANFKQGAENVGTSKYVIWHVYADKHFSAVRSGIKANPNRPEVASEPLRGRIIDLINYLILLGAMLEEDQQIQQTQLIVEVSPPRLPHRQTKQLHSRSSRDGSAL